MAGDQVTEPVRLNLVDVVVLITGTFLVAVVCALCCSCSGVCSKERRRKSEIERLAKQGSRASSDGTQSTSFDMRTSTRSSGRRASTSTSTTPVLSRKSSVEVTAMEATGRSVSMPVEDSLRLSARMKLEDPPAPAADGLETAAAGPDIECGMQLPGSINEEVQGEAVLRTIGHPGPGQLPLRRHGTMPQLPAQGWREDGGGHQTAWNQASSDGVWRTRSRRGPSKISWWTASYFADNATSGVVSALSVEGSRSPRRVGKRRSPGRSASPSERFARPLGGGAAAESVRASPTESAECPPWQSEGSGARRMPMSWSSEFAATSSVGSAAPSTACEALHGAVTEEDLPVTHLQEGGAEGAAQTRRAPRRGRSSWKLERLEPMTHLALAGMSLV